MIVMGPVLFPGNERITCPRSGTGTKSCFAGAGTDAATSSTQNTNEKKNNGFIFMVLAYIVTFAVSNNIVSNVMLSANPYATELIYHACRVLSNQSTWYICVDVNAGLYGLTHVWL